VGWLPWRILRAVEVYCVLSRSIETFARLLVIRNYHKSHRDVVFSILTYLSLRSWDPDEGLICGSFRFDSCAVWLWFFFELYGCERKFGKLELWCDAGGDVGDADGCGGGKYRDDGDHDPSDCEQ